MKKIWYKIYLIKDNEKILLAQVKSKGLAYSTKQLYDNIYKNDKIEVE